MAFSFGSSAPAFGAPAAGAASSGGFSFGGGSAPAFGAPAAFSGGFSFGGGSAPAFGAAAASSGGFSFGGGSAPAFGAAAPASSQPLFGAAAPASTTPSFGGLSAAAPAASSGGFGFGGAAAGALVPAAAPAASPFGTFGGAPAAAAAPAAPSGALTYSSRFDDLPPQVQQAFSQLQQQVSQYDSDRAAVSQMSHLQQEAPDGAKDVGAEAATLQSELRSLQGSMRAEEEALENFRQKAVQLLKAADGVVRTFQRTKLWREAPTQYRGQVAPPQVSELLSQPVLLPSPFLEQAAQGFAEQVAEFKRTVAELEQVLAAQSARHAEAQLGAGGVDVTMALPTVVGNLHDYFTHVAAKLERVHNELQAAKAAHRAALRQQGIHRDPFERAQQAADRAAKTQQHTPSLLPPPAPAGGAPAGGAPGAAGAPSPGGASSGAGGAFGGGGFSSFGSPFPGTPGAFGTPQGAAALGRTTSSKSARPSKSRR